MEPSNEAVYAQCRSYMDTNTMLGLIGVATGGKFGIRVLVEKSSMFGDALDGGPAPVGSLAGSNESVVGHPMVGDELCSIAACV